MLEHAIEADRGVHWLSLLHLGVMRYRAGEVIGARDAWQRSLACEPNAWAQRNLAILALDDGNPELAAELAAAAAKMLPGLKPLAIEACELLLAAGCFGELHELIADLPGDVAATGRIRLIRAIAGVKSGNLAEAEAFFSASGDIPNIREGETSVSDLWFDWQAARLAKAEGMSDVESAAAGTKLRQRLNRDHPLPRDFDYRMQPD